MRKRTAIRQLSVFPILCVRFGRWVKVKVIVCLKVKMKAKPKPNEREPSPRVNGKETIPDGEPTFSNGTLIEMQTKFDDDEISVQGFIFTLLLVLLDRSYITETFKR